MTVMPKYEPPKHREEPSLNFGEGAGRIYNWARYIVANPGKYGADAERVARELLGGVA